MENQTTFSNDQNLVYQRPLAQVRSSEGVNNFENEETGSDETKFCKNPLKIARKLSNPETHHHRYNSNICGQLFFTRRGQNIVTVLSTSLLAIIVYTYYLSSRIMPNIHPAATLVQRKPLTPFERIHLYNTRGKIFHKNQQTSVDNIYPESSTFDNQNYDGQSMKQNEETLLEDLNPKQRLQSIRSQDIKQRFSELKLRQSKQDNEYQSNNAEISGSINDSFSSTLPHKTHMNMFFGTGSYGGHPFMPITFTGDLKMEPNAVENVFPGNIQLPGFKMCWNPRIGGQVDVVNKIPRDLPVFWNIPFSGASVIINIMRSCHRLVTTTTGENLNDNFFYHQSEESNVVLQGNTPLNGYDPMKFINVDMSTYEGILHAKKIGLANRAFVDIIITPHIFQTDHIFYGTDTRGRLFALFKDPVERAVDMFYYIKYATWEPSYHPELEHMSIDQYSQSSFIQNNWMTRTLANVPAHEQLTKEHLNFALEVMRTRILVGLNDSLEESLDRFERYFSWRTDLNAQTQKLCRSRFVSRGDVNPNPKWKNLEQGTGAYHRILRQNRFDMEIYQYAQSLFLDQRQFVSKLVLNIS